MIMILKTFSAVFFACAKKIIIALVFLSLKTQGCGFESN